MNKSAYARYFFHFMLSAIDFGNDLYFTYKASKALLLSQKDNISYLKGMIKVRRYYSNFTIELFKDIERKIYLSKHAHY